MTQNVQTAVRIRTPIPSGRRKGKQSHAKFGRELNPRQEHLLALIQVNLSLPVKERRSLGDLMKEAGYSDSTALVPKAVLGNPGMKGAIEGIVDAMIERRNKAIELITDQKLEGEDAYKLALVVDLLNKNALLLSGRATARGELTIPDEDRKRIDDILARNSIPQV